MQDGAVSLTINGTPYSAVPEQGLTLMRYLREHLGLTGTKCGCGAGTCGSCKVLVNGLVRTSCNLPLSRLEGAEIITIEGLTPLSVKGGPLHPVQQAFLDAGAVQCGFCTPGMIMTAVDLLHRDPCPDEETIRYAFKDNLCRCTGYAKIIDAVKIASSQMAPPERKDGVSGYSPVTQGRSKVTGLLKYTDDLSFPGTLYGKILYAPAPHGIITAIDISEALKLPGVVDIVTFEDSPEKLFNSHVTVPYQDVPKNERIFNKHFRYRGDRIAAVAAVDEKTARKAVSLISLTWEELPFLQTPAQSLADGAYPIHGEGNAPAELSSVTDSADPSADGSLKVYEGVFHTGRVTHAAMEPHAVTAVPDEDEMTVYTSCQNVFCYQAMLSELFDLPFNKVRVIKPAVGGAFGGKSEMVLEPVAFLLALRTGRPVKLTMTRPEVFSSTRTRTPAEVKARFTVDADGFFQSHSYDAVLDRGAYFGSGYDLGYAFMDKSSRLYRAGYIANHVRLAYTNNQNSGAMRGYGNPQISFPREVLIDRICRDNQWDPVTFRLKNLVEPGDTNPLNGQSLGACHPRACLQAGAEHIDWERRRARFERENARPGVTVLKGLGVACGVHGAGIHPVCVDYSTAGLKLFPDGSAVLSISAHENGQGSSIIMKKILSSSLDIPEDHISLAETDTKVTYYDNGSYASRETWVCGQAVEKAALHVKHLLIEEAAGIWSADPRDLTYRDGAVVHTQEPRKQLSRADLVRHAQTTFPFRDIAVIESVSSPFDPGAYFANFAEVEISRESGEIRVTKFLAVHNSGTPINPVMIEGQVEGGLHMGMGFALTEQLEVDPKTGIVSNGNFRKYGFLRSTDMPVVESIFLDEKEEPGPFGAKSIGEATTSGVAPAIVNAISHATGVEFSRLPVTADDIRKVLQDRA